MSLTVTAMIRCTEPHCLRVISLRGGPSVNATAVRDIAENEYGWQTKKGAERCLEHRTRPIRFHPYRPVLNEYGWSLCGDCKGSQAHDSNSRKAIHREEKVREAHAGLTIADWTRK